MQAEASLRETVQNLQAGAIGELKMRATVLVQYHLHCLYLSRQSWSNRRPVDALCVNVALLDCGQASSSSTADSHQAATKELAHCSTYAYSLKVLKPSVPHFAVFLRLTGNDDAGVEICKGRCRQGTCRSFEHVSAHFG